MLQAEYEGLLAQQRERLESELRHAQDTAAVAGARAVASAELEAALAEAREARETVERQRKQIDTLRVSLQEEGRLKGRVRSEKMDLGGHCALRSVCLSKAQLSDVAEP